MSSNEKMEDKIMRFITFMKKNYIKEKSPAGCLARSIKADGKNFPVRTGHDTYRKYLEVYCKADDGVLDAFEECFAKWKEQENKCRKRKP